MRRILLQKGVYARPAVPPRNKGGCVLKELESHSTLHHAFFGCLVAAVLYYALARLGTAILSLQPSNISLLWLPSGLALVMCLRWGAKAIPFIVAASVAANYPALSEHRNAWLHVTVSACADGFAGWLAMQVLRRVLPLGLERSRDLLPFGVWVCMLPNLVSALLIAVNMALGGYITGAAFPAFLGVMFLGDCLGTLLVFPVYQGWIQRQKLDAEQLRWLFATVVAIACIFVAAVLGPSGLIFFVGPALLLLGFHARLLTFSSVSAVTVAALVAMTAMDMGPFLAADPAHTHLRLTSFAFSSALMALGVGLQHQELNQSELSSQVWQNAAQQDALTGLSNRRAFLPLLEREHQQALRTGRPYTLAALDLDHFKRVNDTCGHAAGDEVLKAFARLMRTHCRAVDTVARVGGEEFAILLPDCSLHDAAAVLERMRAAQENACLVLGGREITVTMSTGVASFQGDGLSAAEVFVLADKALYRAKASGRNCIVVCPSA